jgi:hypothetical protein
MAEAIDPARRSREELPAQAVLEGRVGEAPQARGEMRESIDFRVAAGCGLAPGDEIVQRAVQMVEPFLVSHG